MAGINRSYPRSRDEWRSLPVALTDTELSIGDWQVMQSWELPLMKALAREATMKGGNVLEVGFGMGISAAEIVTSGCTTYTVIEAHPDIAHLARQWGDRQEVEVTVIEGFWEDVIDTLPRMFDAILFDTYPLSKEARHKNHYAFIPHAPNVLIPGGVLTMYSDETIDFRAEHLRLLLAHFDEVKLVKVTGLRPPPDCEYWQHDHMVIPVATAGGR